MKSGYEMNSRTGYQKKTTKQDVVKQACATYGPRAECGLIAVLVTVIRAYYTMLPNMD
jgi:hypothetical protein